MSMEFTLEKKAKTSGGDKYVCVDNPKFILYFPQTISRKNGQAHPKLIVTVTPPQVKKEHGP